MNAFYDRRIVRDGRLTVLGCALCSGLVLLVVFPDVLLLKASLISAHYGGPWADLNPTYVESWPQFSGRNIYDGWIDTGGPAWQMDPYRRFLAHAIREGQSPYWNPYIAAGSVTADNLVSNTLSVVTVVTALLGGSDGMYHVVLMTLIFCAELCLMQIISFHLKLSALAALTAGFVFVLNGFVTSSPGTAVVMPYYFAPILFLALMNFVASPNTMRGVIAIAATAAVATNTFIPTVTLSLTFCFLSALGFASVRSGGFSMRAFLRFLPLLTGVGVLALFLDAFLYGPIIDTQLNSVDLKEYQDRRFRYVFWPTFISLLSPKHFWESYNAFSLPAPLPMIGEDHRINLFVHMGITTTLLAAQFFRGQRMAWVFGLLFVATLWRLLGLPGAETIIGKLPIFDIIGPSYWAALLALAVCFCVAYGMDHLQRNRELNLPTLAIALAALANVVFLAIQFQGAVPQRNLIYVTVFLVILAVNIMLFAGISIRSRPTPAIKIILLLLVIAEGIFYVNHLRVARYETVKKLPPAMFWLLAHTDGAAGDRVFNTTRIGLQPDWGAALGIPQIGSMGGLGVERHYQSFFQRYIGSDFGLYYLVRGVNHQSAAPVDRSALDLVGVRYIVAQDGPYVSYLSTFARPVFAHGRLTIFENDAALPRAFLVSSLIFGNGIPQESGVAPRDAATSDDAAFLAHAVEVGVPIVAADKARSRGEIGTVNIKQYNNGSVSLSVDSRSPAVVVLMDAWHRRWSAKVDGKVVPLGRVNHAFRGVIVSAGTHAVEFSYAPPVIVVSIAVSLCTAVLLMILILFRRGIDGCLTRIPVGGVASAPSNV